jgi:hypothetical protein
VILGAAPPGVSKLPLASRSQSYEAAWVKGAIEAEASKVTDCPVETREGLPVWLAEEHGIGRHNPSDLKQIVPDLTHELHVTDDAPLG